MRTGFIDCSSVKMYQNMCFTLCHYFYAFRVHYIKHKCHNIYLLLQELRETVALQHMVRKISEIFGLLPSEPALNQRSKVRS
jgi:hypothetical protein